MHSCSMSARLPFQHLQCHSIVLLQLSQMAEFFLFYFKDLRSFQFLDGVMVV